MPPWRNVEVTSSTKTLPDGSHQFSAAPLRLEAAAATHAGQRESNEDVYGIDLGERLFVVADGMGGRSAGEVAARLAVDALTEFCQAQRGTPAESWPFPHDPRYSRTLNLLRVGLKVANQRIRQEAAGDPAWYRMGATIAALTFDDHELVAAHAGDVRIYRIRQGRASRLTRDHSIHEELRAARAALTPEDVAALGNRNIITRALGSRPEVEPTVYVNRFADDDRYLLCSDGLWSCLPDDAITSLVAGHADPETACHALVDAALGVGAPDNVTALIVRVAR
jgi:serine/threonine protein phosphatase PrpC